MLPCKCYDSPALQPANAKNLAMLLHIIHQLFLTGLTMQILITANGIKSH
jgi:hypothetical protein